MTLEQKPMQKESLSVSMAKLIMVVSLIVGIGAVFGLMGYYLMQSEHAVPEQKTISAIELSADKKSVLDAETKKVIFAIAIANQYLKDSGYAYNPDAFQDTSAKYAGDCFGEVVLSNSRNRVIGNSTVKGGIVFSTSCLSDDLSQAWIGVYNFGIKEMIVDCALAGKSCINDNQVSILTSNIQFLVGSSGSNFVWSADNKTITYEADLGLSGLTEMRTIDSATGEIIKK